MTKNYVPADDGLVTEAFVKVGRRLAELAASGGGGGGLSVIDNGDGTLTIDGSAVVDNGDGTLTIT